MKVCVLKLFYLTLFLSPLQVLKNPVVFMVIVGIIAHFALGQRIPAVLSEFIDGLANSFGGAALFYLGLTMVSLSFVASCFNFYLVKPYCTFSLIVFCFD